MNSRLCWTFAITSLTLFAFALDRLVVAIALPAIKTDLGAQVADLEWTVNAYTLSFAVLLLTGGALGDRFGRRRMFTIGVAIFTAGSAAAALAPTIGALVAARAVQGVGGAIFTPLALTMLSAVTPPERRGAVLGAWGGIGGLGAALGPLAGGVLACLAMYAAVFGALFLITQLLQVGMGATPLQAGLRTLPMAVWPVMTRSQFTSGPPAGSNDAQARQARRKASWTTSSARSGSTTIRRARASRRA